MATIAPAIIALNDVSLVVGTDNYEASVSTVRFEPTTPTITWKGMTPTAVYQVAATATWTATLTYPIDLATINSLANYLLANAGTTKSVVFKPKKPASGVSPTVTATVLIVAGPIGGDIDSVPVGTVTLQVVGQPTVAIV